MIHRSTAEGRSECEDQRVAGIPDPTNTTSRLLERHGYWLGACLMGLAFVGLSDGSVESVSCLFAASALMLWKPLAASRRGFIQGWRGL